MASHSDSNNGGGGQGNPFTMNAAMYAALNNGAFPYNYGGAGPSKGSVTLVAIDTSMLNILQTTSSRP